MCSRGHQASLMTAITQDTRHTATCCSVSALWFFPLSQVGGWPRLRPDAFFPKLPRRILGWSPRSSLILVVSHAISLCVSRSVSSLLVRFCLNSQDTHTNSVACLLSIASQPQRGRGAAAPRGYTAPLLLSRHRHPHAPVATVRV